MRSAPVPYAYATPLVVVATAARGGIRVSIYGEIDRTNRDELATALSKVHLDEAATVDIHLAYVGFCDSEGLHLMVQFLRSAAASGCKTSFRDASPAIRRTARILRLDKGVRFLTS